MSRPSMQGRSIKTTTAREDESTATRISSLQPRTPIGTTNSNTSTNSTPDRKPKGATPLDTSPNGLRAAGPRDSLPSSRSASPGPVPGLVSVPTPKISEFERLQNSNNEYNTEHQHHHELPSNLSPSSGSRTGTVSGDHDYESTDNANSRGNGNGYDTTHDGSVMSSSNNPHNHSHSHSAEQKQEFSERADPASMISEIDRNLDKDFFQSLKTTKSKEFHVAPWTGSGSQATSLFMAAAANNATSTGTGSGASSSSIDVQIILEELGNEEAVQEVYARDIYGRTPVHIAAMNGCADTVYQLMNSYRRCMYRTGVTGKCDVM